LFLSALAFSCGILLARFLWHPQTHWLAAALLLMVCAAGLLRRPACAFAVALFATAMAGGLAYELRPNRAVIYPHAVTEGECFVTAHVSRDGVLQQDMFGGQQESVDLESESIQLADGSQFNEPLGLRVSIYARKARA
jgi:hypothetical protein